MLAIAILFAYIAVPGYLLGTWASVVAICSLPLIWIAAHWSDW